MSLIPPQFPICRFSLSLGADDIKWFMGQLSSAREEEINLFEEEFVQRQGLVKAFFVNSARAGFYEVLQALNLPPKSRILMPAWTHPSMPAMVVAAGHQPRLVDIDPGTYTMGSQVASLSEEQWAGVGAVLITHMYGCPAPVKMLEEEANKRKIPILEDCAQGFGADCGGKPAGSTGIASFYSFALTKNFTTLSGGMIGVRGPALADKLTHLRSRAHITPNSKLYPLATKAMAVRTATTKYGFGLGVYPCLSLGWRATGRDLLHPAFEERFSTVPPSVMSVPAPCQAALGRRMLHRVDAHNNGRNRNGCLLLDMLRSKQIPELGLPALPQAGKHIFMSFVVTHPSRYELSKRLFYKGIDTSPGYLCPISSMDLFHNKVSTLTPIPVAERLGAQQLHLPIYPELTEDQLQYIADSVALCCEEIGGRTKED